ncbi:cupin domain-containing protein [Demequina sp. NBRC 110053]|uniref:cupin domain-containing protein n=1 Tax=Demequina sp. NBRC 110053 TaxID=1570342 RepID=UPI000A03CC37|nr:cupin domain-containing protein [Demequina sp. NBRC 110053]
MEIVGLEALIDQQLALAYDEHSGRHSITLVGDHEHDLRQTLIAVAGGNRLHEHDAPAEATLQVLRGEVTLTVGERELAMSAGDFLEIPQARHGLEAVTDCAMLLTVATRGER